MKSSMKVFTDKSKAILYHNEKCHLSTKVIGNYNFKFSKVNWPKYSTIAQHGI